MNKIFNLKSLISFFIFSFSFFIFSFTVLVYPIEIVYGPYLQNVGESYITVCWTTDNLSSGYVEYLQILEGEGKIKGKIGKQDVNEDINIIIEDLDTTQDKNISNVHCPNIKDLNPSTNYRYRVFSSEGKNEVKSEYHIFRTAKKADEPFSFVVYGDSRSFPSAHQKVISKIIKSSADIVINTGDIVDRPKNISEWDEFFKVATPLMSNVPYYISLGNHDIGHTNFFKFFSLPGNEKNYSFNYGNAHFAVLDTNGNLNEAKKWIENDLKKNTETNNSQFIFVTFHHPPFSSGKHGSSEIIRREICPILEKYKVNIVFNGHDHHYERSIFNGIQYIVTGGGGAELRQAAGKSKNEYSEAVLTGQYHFTKIDISDNKLLFRAYTLDGKVFDNFSIAK